MQADDKITFFKMLSIGHVIAQIIPMSERLSEGANNDPLKFKLEALKLQICRARRLSNNRQTHLTRTRLVIPEWVQEFSRFQVQTANIVSDCINRFTTMGKGVKMDADTDAEAQAGDS
jgi:hypothetical protein